MTEADTLEKIDVPDLDSALVCESAVYISLVDALDRVFAPCENEAVWRLVVRCCGTRQKLLCENHRADALAIGLICTGCLRSLRHQVAWTRL